MHHFFLLFLLISLLPHETSYFAAADSGGGDLCSRACGRATFPYPFGFSSDCPIPMFCDARTSTPILSYEAGDSGTFYHVLAFNSTSSTIIVVLPTSCSRSVADARRALSGGNYGVLSSTAMFLRGGCRGINASAGAGCSLPAAVMSKLLHTAQCADNNSGTSNTTVACASSATQDTAAAATDLFLQWDKVEKQECDTVLTSSVFIDAAEGTVSQEYGLAELGWWVNGTCADAKFDVGCAANATCSDVVTPRGAVGHRCVCVEGMNGDGFLAGDGCYVGTREDASPSNSKHQLLVVVLTSVGCVIFLPSLTIAICILFRRSRRRNTIKKTKRPLKAVTTLFRGEPVDDELDQGVAGPQRFSYNELATATDNFSDDRALGRGGFGSVYRGFVSDMNREVAVKRVSETSRQGWKEFITEVRIISRLKHRNLVQLIGWCHGGDQLLLVYDLMHNGSLDTYLYGSDFVLTWAIRYEIVLGVGSALLYLHQDIEQRVVHRTSSQVTSC
ncbi:hypothetical protein ACQJBY_047272 [Aegilops geniculata]